MELLFGGRRLRCPVDTIVVCNLDHADEVGG
jgi:hypothetical protein